jgi:DNA-binding Lrp family transcriptional regulator
VNVEKEILKLCKKADELKEKIVYLKKVSDIIERAGEISRTDLIRKCHFLNKKRLDVLIKLLIKEGRIKVSRETGSVKQAEKIEWALR